MQHRRAPPPIARRAAGLRRRRRAPARRRCAAVLRRLGPRPLRAATPALCRPLHARARRASPPHARPRHRAPSAKRRHTSPPRPQRHSLRTGAAPVRSFRKNIMSVQAEKGAGSKDDGGDKSSLAAGGGAVFVKVSMDGAPYLRKVDLKMYKSYQELSKALEKMFSSFTIGSCGSQGMNGMNESKLVDLLNGSEYVPTYEDKDGDWMLVGDVPWEMFVESCKRLRIMKGSEAIGLAPRTMEKCKNRS